MKTLFPEFSPIQSFEHLRDRVKRCLGNDNNLLKSEAQQMLDFGALQRPIYASATPDRSIHEFLNFLSDIVINGGVYLFGGILRDLALFGKKGFNSDIDLVVDGNWELCKKYIGRLNPHVNKFGGCRLIVAGWPVDIWNAKDTWAFRQGLIKYDCINSLTKTTVLNWDAILMNWKTRRFICDENYLKELQGRFLDIVLEENPNPIGMFVRTLRHLCLKDAKKISIKAAEYLARCAKQYSFDEIVKSEIRSYHNSVIEKSAYDFFKCLNNYGHLSMHEKFKAASNRNEKDGLSLSSKQLALNFVV